MSSDEELVAVRAAHRFDEVALASYLGGRLESFAGDLTVRQFEGGQSNPTYLLEAGGRRWVLRKKPPGPLLPMAHRVDREYRILSALRDTGVPVPRTDLLCEDESVIGSSFFVMEYVEGRLLRSPTLPGFEPAERRAVYAELSRVLAVLHAVDYQRVGLEGYGRPEGFFARQITRFARQYQATKTEEIPAMDRLGDWLSRNIPPDDETSIVHGDFRLENMLLHPTEPRIVALLDWELSTLGHPLADVAWFCLSYRTDSPLLDTLMGANVSELGIPGEEEFVEQYLGHASRTAIDGWPFYLAFSMFRLASILQGVTQRAIQGNASSERAMQLAPWIRKSADEAWAVVEG